MIEKPIHQKKELSAVNRSLDKIIINTGVGRLSNQPNFEEKILPQISKDLALITGQKPQVCRARKSIASFKIREGQIVGLRVTLRRRKMVDFFGRLIKIVLPRVRDFSGIDKKSVDAGGVLNIGVKEHSVFPEINAEDSLINFPLGINVVPKGKHREESLNLYTELGVPFKKSPLKSHK